MVKDKEEKNKIPEKEEAEFLQVSSEERESDLEDIEEKVGDVEEVEEEENLEDFSQFVSGGGEIVEIAPDVSQTLVSGEKPITNLDDDLAFVKKEDGGQKEDKEFKYATSEQVYQQAGEARAYEEMREQERAEGRQILNRGLQVGEEVNRITDFSPRIDTNVHPLSIPEMRQNARAGTGEEVRKADYVSVSEIEKDKNVFEKEKRKYQIGG